MDLDAIISQSLTVQTNIAATDSLGLCIFGRSVTEPNVQFIVDAINAAHGTSLTPDFFPALGRETLPFKRDVRKLKELGLTRSLEVGYEISPRGRAYLG